MLKIKLIFSFLLFSIFIYSGLNYKKNEKIENYLYKQTKLYQTIQNSFYTQYSKHSNIIYETLINENAIINILKIIENSNDKTIPKVLNKQLFNLVSHHKGSDIIHFVSSKNKSILRVYMKDKFNDDLSSNCKLIVYANRYRKPLSGFEISKKGAFYKFIYPIFDKEKNYIGCVVIGYDNMKFAKEFIDTFKVASNFHFRETIIDKKFFQGIKENEYKKSPIVGFYVLKKTKKENKKSIGNNFKPFTPNLNLTNFLLKNINNNNPFSIHNNDQNIIITFLPITNSITNEVVAFQSIRTDDEYVQYIISSFNKAILISIVFIFIILVFLYILLKNKDIENKKLIKEKEKTRLIFDAQSSIVVVSNGIKASKINKKFFEDYNYKNLDDFNSKHHCICELFIDKAFTSHLMPMVDGVNWIEHMNKNPNETHIAYLINKNNKEKVYEVHSSTLILNDEVEVEDIIIFTDITEIHKLNATLGEQIRDVVIELERQANEHEKNIIDNTKFSTIGQMAAGITHEINTPLTYIKGTMEMSKYDLEDMPENDFKQRLLEDNLKVLDGINRMAIIIESMREMSQTSNHTNKALFNVYSTLIIVLRMIYNRSKQVCKIYINNELFSLGNSDKDKYKFMANIHKQRIEQVWTIILNNALDELVKIENYDNRRIDINISEQKGKLKIQFKDNAGGIPETIKDKIFEPFVSSKESSGIGIGLNVAQKIIEEHYSTIEATNITVNRDGKKSMGACFTIKLKT